ncbi:oxidoreductase family protein [Streptomyces sp. 2333.5]|nr:oxidoreductase family protein [Streptomyces sp. 2333.5]SEC94744.1 Oxidoreductase family, NAD-binding Rossmann fold [Streptomyces sp. 2314.4]SED80573.1 Oxidoreductase family, NAD-binding Rossmann fold [Streptomyces sp. 2112.2]
MTRTTVRIAMNGVTGRMGYRQHLVRSLLALRDQGGLALADGTVIRPEPVLVGRSAPKLRALAARHDVKHWSCDLDAVLGDDGIGIYFDAQVTAAREEAVKKAIAAGKHLYVEKPTAIGLAGALELARLAREAGVKNGVVQDKLFLPGLRKLRRLVEGGFFGRILSVRGEFGYWVFEGDWQPAQRPSWNYRAEDGGGIAADMFPHWEYVLRELFGPVRSVQAHVATHIPRRWDESGTPYAAGHRRADQLLLGGPGAPRRTRGVPGGRHRGVGRRRAAPLPGAAPRRHAEAGLGPRRPGL